MVTDTIQRLADKVRLHSSRVKAILACGVVIVSSVILVSIGTVASHRTSTTVSGKNNMKSRLWVTRKSQNRL